MVANIGKWYTEYPQKTVLERLKTLFSYHTEACVFSSTHLSHLGSQGSSVFSKRNIAKYYDDEILCVNNNSYSKRYGDT